MKHKRILALLLSLILLFSVFASSCAEEPAPSADDPAAGEADPPNGGQPADDGGEEQPEEEQYVYYHYQYVDVLVPYVKPEFDGFPYYEWRNDVYMVESDAMQTNCYIEKKPWSEDMLPYKAGAIIQRSAARYYSYTTVYETVYDWLESEDGGTRQFLIRPNKLCQGNRDQYDSQEAYLSAWCEDYLPDGTVVDGLGFALWEGTADELVEIAECRCNRIIVCFPEDFEAIYGMTAEQAGILVEFGILGDWSSPKINSPLYGLSPAEIAAYIAAHPEILEE